MRHINTPVGDGEQNENKSECIEKDNSKSIN